MLRAIWVTFQSQSDNVETLITDKPLHVNLSDGRTLVGPLNASTGNASIRTSSGDVSVARSAIVIARNDAEQLAYESSLNPGWLKQWRGGLDIGLALTKGNSDTTKRRNRTWISPKDPERQDQSLRSFNLQSRQYGWRLKTTANTTRFGGRYERDFNRKWFGYVFTDLERNGQQDLNLRFVPGGGVGYHAIRNESTQLDLLGGMAMNREYFDGSDNDRTSAEAQIGQTLVHQLNSRMLFKEQLFIFPNLTETGEYRINFDASVVTDITRRIGWQLTASDRYLSNPPPGLKQNDLVLTTGIRVKLGDFK